jgi:hypothetical protein
MFVVTNKKLNECWPLVKKITYGNPVVNNCPQKEDPYCICITVGSNPIKYESIPLVHTADLDTAKLHWKSVVSTSGTKYMCLTQKNIAPLNWTTSSKTQVGFNNNIIWLSWH